MEKNGFLMTKHLEPVHFIMSSPKWYDCLRFWPITGIKKRPRSSKLPRLMKYGNFCQQQNSVADYYLTPYAVVVGVVVVGVVDVSVVVGVWDKFLNGITFERLEISTWFFVCGYIMSIRFSARNFSEIGWCKPAQPAYQLKFYKMGYNLCKICPIWLKFGMQVSFTPLHHPEKFRWGRSIILLSSPTNPNADL